MDNSNYIKAKEKIDRAKNILLVTHDRPDPDGISSLCILAEYINSLGKNFFAYCPDKPLAQLWFLPQIEKIKTSRNEFVFSDFDLIIAVDCGAVKRTNLAEEIRGRNKDQLVIEFDHHPKVEDFADLEIRDASRASTTEVLYYFFKENKIKITKNIATGILTGVLGDTGVLLYPSTSKETMQIASEMIASGARMAPVSQGILRNKSLSGMRIWGRAMENLRINKKYNFAFSVLTLKDLAGEEISDEDTEGIAGFLSGLSGVKALLFLREEKESSIRGSLRSVDDNIDVSLLARFLGGGGHRRAAGFKIDGALEKINSGWQIK